MAFAQTWDQLLGTSSTGAPMLGTRTPSPCPGTTVPPSRQTYTEPLPSAGPVQGPSRREEGSFVCAHRSGISFSKLPVCCCGVQGPEGREGGAGACRTVRRGCRPTVGPAPLHPTPSYLCRGLRPLTIALLRLKAPATPNSLPFTVVLTPLSLLAASGTLLSPDLVNTSLSSVKTQ